MIGETSSFIKLLVIMSGGKLTMRGNDLIVFIKQSRIVRKLMELLFWRKQRNLVRNRGGWRVW